MLDWFKSYLTNRSQRFQLMGSSSDWAAVHSGLPQGSVLDLYFSTFLLLICHFVFSRIFVNMQMTLFCIESLKLKMMKWHSRMTCGTYTPGVI